MWFLKTEATCANRWINKVLSPALNGSIQGGIYTCIYYESRSFCKYEIYLFFNGFLPYMVTLILWNDWICHTVEHVCYRSNVEGLRRIVTEFRPLGICLQETKLRSGRSIRTSGYVSYSKELQLVEGERAHGGVAVCIRENMQAVHSKYQSSAYCRASNRTVAYHSS